VKSYRNLNFLIFILIYINIFFGPLVRATDSGLACPDWPLCYGEFIPRYTFQIAMEVGHRFYSGLIGILILGGVLWTVVAKDLRKYFLLSGGILILLITQVALGALTVTKLLDPTTVNLHLLNASLLLLLCITLSLLVDWDLKSLQREPFHFQNLFHPGTRLILFLMLFTAYQIFIGARVSSHYSGLACPDFPTCYGEWFPEMVGTIRYQMEHRWIGYGLALSIFVGTALFHKFGSNPISKKLLILSCVLIVAQILIGAMNVWLRLPKILTAFHTLTGITLLICLHLALLHQMLSPHKETKER